MSLAHTKLLHMLHCTPCIITGCYKVFITQCTRDRVRFWTYASHGCLHSCPCWSGFSCENPRTPVIHAPDQDNVAWIAAVWLGMSPWKTTQLLPLIYHWHRSPQEPLLKQQLPENQSNTLICQPINYLYLQLASFKTIGQIVFNKEFGHCLSTLSGDTMERRFLFQCISTTLQHFNAIAIHGTFPASDLDESWNIIYFSVSRLFKHKSLGNQVPRAKKYVRTYIHTHIPIYTLYIHNV